MSFERMLWHAVSYIQPVFLVCDDWYFGNNCSSRCNCLIKPCDKETGECQIGGCQTEWHGESCNQGIQPAILILSRSFKHVNKVNILLLLSHDNFIFFKNKMTSLQKGVN